MFLSLGTSTNSAGPVENRQTLFKIEKLRHNCKKAHKSDRYIKKKKKSDERGSYSNFNGYSFFLFLIYLFTYFAG